MRNGLRNRTSSSLRPSNVFPAFPLLAAGALFLSACGASTEEARFHSAPRRNYGMTFDVPLYCTGNTAAQSLDIVLESAKKLSAFCEMQNIESQKAGYLRCPTGLCQQEYSPGGTAVPTMKFTVSNGSSMSSMFGGYGGGSGGSGGSGSSGSVFGSRVYVTLEFNLPLARTPDTLSCVNPLNASVQTTVLNEILKASMAPQTGPCVSQ
jgi:hypothetical protein